MRFDKEEYRKRRNDGLRGQGDETSGTVRRNLARGRVATRNGWDKPSLGISSAQRDHEKRQKDARRDRIKRKEQGERDRLAKNLEERLEELLGSAT